MFSSARFIQRAVQTADKIGRANCCANSFKTNERRQFESVNSGTFVQRCVAVCVCAGKSAKCYSSSQELISNFNSFSHVRDIEMSESPESPPSFHHSPNGRQLFASIIFKGIAFGTIYKVIVSSDRFRLLLTIVPNKRLKISEHVV